MLTTYEGLLKVKILPDLEAGRPNWDEPHTRAVVKHMKAIIENNPDLNLDQEILTIAAYAHDWGYSGLFKGGKPLNMNDVSNAKEAHMKHSGQKLRELLKDPIFNFLSEERKQRAVHLTQRHDKLNELKDVDELVLMEADTLGGLDIEEVKPTFDKESNDRYMKGVREKRLPLFITEYGKMEFERLYKARQKYYLEK